MSDVVVTVPKGIWPDWIAEGDAAGETATGEEWGFYLGGARPPCGPGDRCYVVAHGRLRGYAPVVRVERTDRGWAIARGAAAVAVTLAGPITGFRGWRTRWWDRSAEAPFPGWETEGVRVACAMCHRQREPAIVLRAGERRILRDGVPVCGPCLLAAIERHRAGGGTLNPRVLAAEPRARDLARRVEIATEHEERQIAAQGRRARP